MKRGRTTLHFERDRIHIDVEHVAALLCRRCRTRCIPGVVALKLSEVVERLCASTR